MYNADKAIKDFPMGWESEEICSTTYYGDGEIYGEACTVTGYSWMENPSDPVMIDQSGWSGGMGGTYVPNFPEGAPDYLSHNRQVFPAINYLESTKSKRVSHIMNYIRYCFKNKINVDLNKIFANMPTSTTGANYTTQGYPFDSFSGNVILNGKVVPITLVEVPLDPDYRVFRNYVNEYTDVYPNGNSIVLPIFKTTFSFS